MKAKLYGLAWAFVAILAGVSIYQRGYNDGRRRADIEAEKYWIEAILTRHLGYLVKQDGRESFIEFRHVPKVRRCPVIHRDANGNEIDKGGKL